MSAAGLRVREIVTFLGVGAIAFVVQVVLLNVLVTAELKALPANAVAITVSMFVAYVGNRRVTFAHRARGDVLRERVAFVVVNIVTLAVSEGLLALAYVDHGEHDRLLLNLLNLLGIAAGTALRYFAYRRWVFTDAAERRQDALEGSRATAGPEATTSIQPVVRELTPVPDVQSGR